MARGIARLRSGLKDYDRRTSSPGPEIAVAPFDAHNVSTPAALIKLGTSIAAARRHKANLDYAQQDVELGREKTRAEIARIKAESQYYAGTGRQPAGRAPTTTTMPIHVGGKTYPAGTDRGDLNLIRGVEGDARRAATQGKLSASQAALSEIDTRIDREAKTHASAAMRKLDPYIAALAGEDPKLRAHSLDVFRKLFGMDLTPYTTAGLEYVTPNDVASRQKSARETLERSLSDQARRVLESRYGGERQRHQQTIRELSGSLEQAPSDLGGVDADQNDPGGVGEFLGREGP
jgi:hypothetical protein